MVRLEIVFFIVGVVFLVRMMWISEVVFLVCIIGLFFSDGKVCL